MITYAAALLIIGTILLALSVAVIGAYLWLEQRQRQRQERQRELARKSEEEGQRLSALIQAEINQIQTAIEQFSRNVDSTTGYFSNYQLGAWKSSYSRIYNELKGHNLGEPNLGPEVAKTVAAFVGYFRDADSIRADFNRTFLAEELERYRGFFDQCIEGKSLDTQQRTAVVTDEDNNLVIAGAGTGKTTTILGKVYYVVDRYTVPPEELLLISFTNKSASDLAKRIKIPGIEVKTFHKFGKDVIEAVEGQPPSIFDEEQFRPLLTRFFKQLLRDPSFVARVTGYFTDYLKRPKSAFEFKSQGDYIQYLKDQNFLTYKQKLVQAQGRTTYRMEVVKSIEECKIANFLFFNNVDYEYELPYEFDVPTPDHRAYKPDFTIQQRGRKLYLEHFALDRNGNIPSFFTKEDETYQQAKNRYYEKLRWARATHTQHKTRLIETYSYEMSEGTLFQNLTQKLNGEGFTLRPKPPEEIWRIITETAPEEVESFLDLLRTFITLMKSNNYTLADVREKNTHTQDNFEEKRNALFLEIVGTLVDLYERHLRERKEIDFSDMINRAAHYIAEGNHARIYRYVIVDEFQDISVGRYQLVRAIKERNPGCKLFCVGDDWQSIYRFTGSDIALFRDFDRFFGCTVRSKIETTYRFHEPLIKLSSDFILRNPNQERKDLRGTLVPTPTAFEIVYSENQDDTLALRQVFDQLVAVVPNIDQKEILVLGRYTFDIDRIKNQARLFRIDRQTETICYSPTGQPGARKLITAQFLTVHKAKGLEADFVIVINCNSGKHGFPSQMTDDPVLNLLLNKADQFENGEERRLFYVAMTRAKEKVFFIADRTYKSKFVSELETKSKIVAARKCPRCKTADLVKRSGAKNGRSYAFMGCSNYLYGCEYTEPLN